MTEDQLLQSVRDWIGDVSRSYKDTISGLENVRELCDGWLPALRHEAAKAAGGE